MSALSNTLMYRLGLELLTPRAGALSMDGLATDNEAQLIENVLHAVRRICPPLFVPKEGGWGVDARTRTHGTAHAGRTPRDPVA